MYENKHPIVLLPSAARTTAQAVTFNTQCPGGILIIDITAVSGSPSLTFTLQGQDPASNKNYTILASSALTGTGTTILRVHPELTGSANSIAKDMLPHQCRLSVAVGTADSVTYSVGFIGTR
jgi:hypothetical protein